MKVVCKYCGCSSTVPSDVVAWDCPDCEERNEGPAERFEEDVVVRETMELEARDRKEAEKNG